MHITDQVEDHLAINRVIQQVAIAFDEKRHDEILPVPGLRYTRCGCRLAMKPNSPNGPRTKASTKTKTEWVRPGRAVSG